MTTYHCELAWLGGTEAEPDVVLEIGDDGTFLSVTTSGPTGGATFLPGLTLPGLANAHSHAFHRALRSRTHAGTGDFWSWREQMYALAARLTPESYLELARATFAEMVQSGITCVGEFHYLHHAEGGVGYTDENAMGDSLIEAARQAGLRLTLLDTCYLQGGITAELSEIQRRFSDGDALSWATRVSALDPVDTDRVRLGAAIHSVRAVDPASMAIVAAWAADRGAPLHAHVSEQPAENAACIEAYGCTPTELLARRGVLGDRFTAVHATHVTPHDVELLGAARASVCLCPTTERDLADGIGPARALRAGGAGLTLGTDSHAVIDLFEEMRAVELDERLASGDRGIHRPVDLLTAATAAGHASLGWPEAGRLATGAPADFVTIGLDSVRTAGSPPSAAVAAAVFAAGATDVRRVVVAGEVIVEDGHHVRLDVAGELSRTISRLTDR